MNNPPVDPAITPPTLPPETEITVRTSFVSVSLSAPLPLSTRTLPLNIVSAFTVIASFCAVGPSFMPLTVMVTVAVSVPPLPSLTV